MFPLTVVHVGEKVNGQNLFADFKFFGTSPLQYLEPSKPYRAVYVCFQSEYQTRQKRAIADYSNTIATFRADRAALTDQDPTELLADFNKLIEREYHSMASLIQLEAGHYELDVVVSYDCVGWMFSGNRRETRSKLSFTVEEADVNRWKGDLRRLLEIRGQQILTEKYGDLVYPTLTPVDVQEA